MNYTLAIYAHPETNTGKMAYDFANTLLVQGHSLSRLFFFGDGVYNGVSSDESTLPALWQQLIKQSNTDAVICVTAAASRGIGIQDGYKRPLKSFEISGLGQLIDAISTSDRFVTFG